MRRTISALIVLCTVVSVWLGTARLAPAQPVLERLERRIRERLNRADKEPGYLGVVVDDKNDRGRGVRILEVRPGGPGDRAGLQRQDLITGVAGIRVRQMSDMADVLPLFPAGDSLEFDILRGEKRETIKVTLGRRPPRLGQPSQPPEVVPRPPAVTLPAEAPVEVPEGAGEPAQDDEQPPATGPQLQPPDTPDRPPDAATEIEQLRHRIEQLERRVAELERALTEALKRE